MKKMTRLVVCALLFCFATTQAQQVQQFTPYDELPSVEKILKPRYENSLPDWAKMLYQYPVNFHQVNKAYNIWEQEELKRTGLKKVRNPLVRYYKLWQKHLQPYVSSDGTIHLPDIEQLNKELIESQQPKTRQMLKAKSENDGSQWTFLGPKETFWLNERGSSIAPSSCPWQVNVYSFDVFAADNNILYCGTETGYVNKTIDKGKNWTLLAKDYVFGGGVTAVAIHPTNSDIVYVAAGKTIHKTTDGGITWRRSIRIDANRLKIDHTNPSTIHASTHNGMYTTTNGGRSWNRESANNTWDVEIKPDDPNIIYAITLGANNKFGIIESTNGGKDYAFVPGFPDNIEQHSGGMLAVTPANPNVLYAVLLSKNEGKRPYLYKGIRNGLNDWTWTLQHKGSDGSFTSNKLTNGQGYFDLVLEVSPTNEKIVFVGTTTLFKSHDSGKRLTPVGGYAGRFAIHPDIQDMKMLPTGDMWVSTDGGMNYSKDNFTYNINYTSPNKNLIGSDMWGFDQGWNEDIIVGGRYHNGNTAITDFYGDKALRMGGAESPTGWVIQGKSRHVAFDDLGAGWILPKTAEGKPEGRFVFSKHPNMDGYGADRSNVATHPYYSGTLYLGSENGIWISQDYGANFDLLHNFPGRVRYLNISTANPNVIYVDVIGKGLYRTADSGKTWELKTAPIRWAGDITFAISPYNADVLYAAHQNGVNWVNESDVYKTTDGGSSWTKWSESQYGVKSIVIQPTNEEKDLVYLFITSNGSKPADVYYRKDGKNTQWKPYGANYPRGLRVNIALPFFRDSKLRVSGNSGVWESPLAEPNFKPIIVPWANKKEFECELDTIQLDCHSWLNHKDATWSWSFSKTPDYISNKDSRNPKVVFEKVGSYDVTLTVKKGSETFTKTVPNMIRVKPCPDINDCENPAELPKSKMTLIEADSYQPGNEPAKAFDGNPNTIWHTPWGANETRPPHHIAIDLGEDYDVSQMTYTTRPDGDNGNIKAYELYLSKDKANWGKPIKKGTFQSSNTLSFEKTTARYAKLVALSEVKDRAWTSVAELTFVGCKTNTGVFDITNSTEVTAFPIPATNLLTVNLPYQDGINTFSYTVYAGNGQVMSSGNTETTDSNISIEVTDYAAGYYFVSMKDTLGTTYRVKFIKR